MKAFDQFMLSLALRLVASWKSTFLGIAFALGADILGRLTADPSLSPYVHTIAVMISIPFLAYRDRHIAEGSAVKFNIPGAMIIAFLFLFPAMARAQTPTARTAAATVSGGTLADVAPSDPAPAPVPTVPQIGGCFRSGSICVGPSLAISLAAVNFSTKKVEGAFAPGVGLGVTFMAKQWYSVGLAGYLNLDPGANNASVAVLAAFLNGYARVGISKGFIGDTSTRLLFGTGIDL